MVAVATARTEGRSQGTSTSVGETYSDSTTTGWGEGIHKRSLLNADEIGRFLSRIDERDHAAYPGLVLAITPGRDPLLARRVNYFEAPVFAGRFDPHPDHPPPPTLAELAAMAQRPAAAPALPSPTPSPSESSSTGILQAIAAFFRGLLSTWKLVGLAVVVAVALVIWLGSPPESETEPATDLDELRPGAASAPGKPSETVNASVRPPQPANRLNTEGKIFPFGAKAWAAPAVGTTDPSVGIFSNGTRVEILDRVAGPHGWDWLKVRGLTTGGQTVEAFVRSDLVAGTNIRPQPGTRCAKDNLLEKFGRTPVYDQAVIEAMSGLEDNVSEAGTGPLAARNGIQCRFLSSRL